MHLVLVLTQGSLNSKLLSLRGLPRYLYSPSCREGMFGLDPVWWTPESLEAKPPERESICRTPEHATQRSLKLRLFS